MCPSRTVSAKAVSQTHVGATKTGTFDREALEGNRGCGQVAETIEATKRGGVGTEEALEKAKEFCEPRGHVGARAGLGSGPGSPSTARTPATRPAGAAGNG